MKLIKNIFRISVFGSLYIGLALVLFSQEDPFAPNVESGVRTNDRDKAKICDLRGTPYCDSNDILFNSEVLLRSGELSLSDMNASSFALRITIKPTFEKPIVLKMVEDDKACNLSVRRLSGLGGYELGHVELIAEVKVSKNESAEIFKIVRQASVQNLTKMTSKQRESMRAQDGIVYTVEIFSGGKLSVIDVFFLNLDQDLVSVSPFLTKDAITSLAEIVKLVFRASGISNAAYIKM